MWRASCDSNGRSLRRSSTADETDVLSHLDFPEQHRSKLHDTNPLKQLLQD